MKLISYCSRGFNMKGAFCKIIPSISIVKKSEEPRSKPSSGGQKARTLPLSLAASDAVHHDGLFSKQAVLRCLNSVIKE